MELYNYLMQQLKHALVRQKKAEKISMAAKELDDVCGELKSHTEHCIEIVKRNEDLSNLDKEKTDNLNKRYNSAIEKLKKLRM